MTDKETVTIIHAEYSGYDKYLHSKVKRPEKYAVKLIPEAEKLIGGITPCAPVRADKRRVSHRASCRMTKTKLGRLQRAFKARGYTTQAGLDKLTDMFLEKPDILPER